MANIDDLYERAMSSLKSSRKETFGKDQWEEYRKIYFPKGSTVFLILRKRSSSGMSREIGVVTFKRDGSNLIDLHPNHAVSVILGLRRNKNGDGVHVSGAGMDMGMHLVTNLAARLYGDERALKYRWL